MTMVSGAEGARIFRESYDKAKRESSLSSDLVSLRWSPERPSVDGYYWSRVDYRDENPEIVRVNNSSIFANGMWQNEVYVTGEDEPYLHEQFVQERGGEWCGPLSVPEVN